jgi:hypothetical protein
VAVNAARFDIKVRVNRLRSTFAIAGNAKSNPPPHLACRWRFRVGDFD